MSRVSPLAFGASVVVIVAVPVATWWLVGDLSEPVADPDYMFHPVVIPPPQERVLGFGALVMVGVGVLVLVHLLRGRRLDRKRLPPVAFLVVAGTIAGFGWRVVTAGVIGANIGGGLIMLFAVPLVAVLVIAALLTSFLYPARQPATDRAQDDGPPRRDR